MSSHDGHSECYSMASMGQGLPESTRNYSITGLEMCGLAINIASFMYLLTRVDFNAIVDHLAMMHKLKVTRTDYH